MNQNLTPKFQNVDIVQIRASAHDAKKNLDSLAYRTAGQNPSPHSEFETASISDTTTMNVLHLLPGTYRKYLVELKLEGSRRPKNRRKIKKSSIFEVRDQTFSKNVENKIDVF